ncbi:MAG TPA: DUF512 domain-containing protein, partial [Acidimicrobiales bacterium]|nr:DUF512 domain-containing protein [Acidimicrobiales bacterium]
TLAGIADRFPALASVGVVPLGLSRFSSEPEMRPHTPDEAAAVLDAVTEWQRMFRRALGRRLVFASDEYYLMAGREVPGALHYEGFPQHENGIGMARAFADGFVRPRAGGPGGVRHGFFAAVDAAPAEGYRAARLAAGPGAAAAPAGGADAADDRPVCILTGDFGAAVLAPLVAGHPRTDVEVRPVANEFFGGTIGVAGLLTGADLGRAAAAVPEDVRCLMPDACLNQGRFLDGLTLADLPRPVEVVPSDGASLRRALEGISFRPRCAP